MNNSAFLPEPFGKAEQRIKKDRLNRLQQYVRALDTNSKSWFEPDLGWYRDLLLQDGTRQPTTIDSHLAAIRSRYTELLKDPKLETLLLNYVPFSMTSQDFINLCRWKMETAADPANTKLEYDRPAKNWTQLSPVLVSALLNSPDMRTLRGKRDIALIALILFIGLRESEVRLLTKDDVRMSGGAGESGIQVPEGAASKARFVPFYPDFPTHQILSIWLEAARIESGPVLRGFYRGGSSLRHTMITLQGIEDVFRQYPVEIDGKITQITPFDLRRYHARMLYSLDYEIDVIAENMGVRTETVVDYIGLPDGNANLIPSFEWSRLYGY